MNFFKKRSNTKLKSSSINAETLIGEELKSSDETVKPALHFLAPPQNPEDRYYFQFLLNEYEAITPNQIRLDPIELNKTQSGLAVQFFIQNSSAQTIQFKDAELLLVTEEGQLLGTAQLNLTNFEPLPAKTASPLVLVFKKENLVVPMDSIPDEVKWMLIFKQRTLDLDSQWLESLTLEDQVKLQNLDRQFGSPAENEIETRGISLQQTSEGDLQVIVLFRSGYYQAIEIRSVPLRMLDANNEIVCEGQFDTGGFTLKGYSSKPWIFMFPKERLLKKSPDFSSWHVQIIPPTK